MTGVHLGNRPIDASCPYLRTSLRPVITTGPGAARQAPLLPAERNIRARTAQNRPLRIVAARRARHRPRRHPPPPSARRVGSLASGYYLVAESAEAGTGSALPPAEATRTIAMGASAGRVALVRASTVGLTCGAPARRQPSSLTSSATAPPTAALELVLRADSDRSPPRVPSGLPSADEAGRTAPCGRLTAVGGGTFRRPAVVDWGDRATKEDPCSRTRPRPSPRMP